VPCASAVSPGARKGVHRFAVTRAPRSRPGARVPRRPDIVPVRGWACRCRLILAFHLGKLGPCPFRAGFRLIRTAHSSRSQRCVSPRNVNLSGFPSPYAARLGFSAARFLAVGPGAAPAALLNHAPGTAPRRRTGCDVTGAWRRARRAPWLAGRGRTPRRPRPTAAVLRPAGHRARRKPCLSWAAQ